MSQVVRTESFSSSADGAGRFREIWSGIDFVRGLLHLALKFCKSYIMIQEPTSYLDHIINEHITVPTSISHMQKSSFCKKQLINLIPGQSSYFIDGSNQLLKN